MNRKSGFYQDFKVVIFILAISIAALWQTAAAQGNNTGDFQKPQKFVIGIQPEKNIYEQRKAYKAIAQYIAKYLDINVYIYTLPNYTSLFEAFSEGIIDAAFLGSFSYVLTRDEFPIDLLVRPVWPDDTSTYRGYIFARKDSGIRSLADMEGKSLVLVDMATTAGYLYPLYYLKKNGINSLNSHFSDIYFAGSHDGSAWAVFKAEADVGACKDRIFNSLAAEFPQFEEQMVVLAESFGLPSNGLGVRSDLDRGFKERLRDLLLDIDKSEEGRQALKPLGAVRFIPTGDADYRALYRMIDHLQLNPDILRDNK